MAARAQRDAERHAELVQALLLQEVQPLGLTLPLEHSEFQRSLLPVEPGREAAAPVEAGRLHDTRHSLLPHRPILTAPCIEPKERQVLQLEQLHKTPDQCRLEMGRVVNELDLPAKSLKLPQPPQLPTVEEGLYDPADTPLGRPE